LNDVCPLFSFPL